MERQESLPERRRLRPRSAIGENVVVSAKQPAKSKRRHQSTQKHSGPSSGGRQSPEFPELDLTNRSGVVPSNRITAVERPDRQLRRRNITDAQRQAIYGMFEQGSTGRKIAGTLGVQLYDVQRELLLVGKTLSGRSGSGRGMSRASNAKKQLVCQLFQEDLSMCVICDRVGLSMPTVSKILHLAGKDVKQRFLKNSRRHGGTIRRKRQGKPRNSSRATMPKSSLLREKVVLPEEEKEERSNAFPTGAASEQSAHESIMPTSVHTVVFNSSAKEVIIGCHASPHPYRCEGCQFHCKAEQTLISHLLGGQHQQLCRNALLVCADCRFRSSQIIKMARHCIKHSALPMEINGKFSTTCAKETEQLDGADATE